MQSRVILILYAVFSVPDTAVELEKAGLAFEQMPGSTTILPCLSVHIIPIQNKMGPKKVEDHGIWSHLLLLLSCFSRVQLCATP